MATEPTGPRIPGSEYFNSNYTKDLECTTIICNSLSDGQATLTGGQLSNMNDPVNPQDAATKAYCDSILSIVADPLYSIQYNNNNQFDGSSNLTFDGSELYSLTTVIGTASSMLTINSGIIDNLPVPTTLKNPISKSYVDVYNTLNVVTTAATSTTYGASSMVNSILIKSSGTSSDATDSAANIITYITSVLKPVNIATTYTNCKFTLKNVHTSESLSVAAGINVTIVPTTSSLTIYSGYELDTILQVTSASTVKMFVNNLNWIGSTNINNSNFLIGPRSMYTSSNDTRIANKFNFNTNITTLTTQNVVYKATNLTGIVHRSFEGTKTDTFGSVSAFITSYSSLNSPIYYIYTTGAVEIVIRNTSVLGSITLTSNTEWTMDPNSNMTIGPGKTGYFYLYIDTINELGYVYTIGIMNTA